MTKFSGTYAVLLTTLHACIGGLDFVEEMSEFFFHGRDQFVWKITD